MFQRDKNLLTDFIYNNHKIDKMHLRSMDLANCSHQTTPTPSLSRICYSKGSLAFRCCKILITIFFFLVTIRKGEKKAIFFVCFGFNCLADIERDVLCLCFNYLPFMKMSFPLTLQMRTLRIKGILQWFWVTQLNKGRVQIKT